MDPSVLICDPSISVSWIADLWYAGWLVVVVSLVWSASRFEQIPKIFQYSLRCAIKMVIVLLVALIVLLLMDWMT